MTMNAWSKFFLNVSYLIFTNTPDKWIKTALNIKKLKSLILLYLKKIKSWVTFVNYLCTVVTYILIV